MIASAVVIASIVVAAAALVAAERGGRRGPAVFAKVIASAGFVVLALMRSRLSTPYDRWVLVALVACLVGDVLLSVPRAFPAGLASFLLGHIGFIAAFSTVLPLRGWPPLAGVALAVVSVAVALWLWPHLGNMRAAVLAYIAVITVMAWGATAAAGRSGWTTCAAGLLFYLSDFAVARDRFVLKRFASRAWGLPIYYVAQVLFALTLTR